jgi:solute carrier family 25 phosphate transporter 3
VSFLKNVAPIFYPFQGLTHTLVTPLDLVKCRRQVDPHIYRGNLEGWAKIYRAEGLRGVFTGWGPTFFGYSVSIL